MKSNSSGIFNIILILIVALWFGLSLFALQKTVPLAYAANSTGNAVLTITVPLTCEISLVQSITFGTILPGANSVTTSQNVLDTNSGNEGAFAAVDGGNWIGTSNSLNTFGVGNTVWSAGSSVTFASANALTATAANTNVAVGSGSSANIWFGLGIPTGQAADSYTQNIVVINLC